ncbi:hypothetical protein YK48G_03980 [Lentilactobacillus fungorum]|uniref:Phage neck terminator protein gp12-like domain-containing protein n=1 Tax=Lentilactobacillus fungorum TaxID=2201250 RepID=A0ABQ3VWE0_9LACO|nr:hypothetical protein [Lentilactobacillus fungorum]GHP12973.1 hypothetical protein YK48G_03980 [Lentilactobacillus fungorum]
MSDYNLYDAISAALVKQIKQYFPGVPVRPQSIKKSPPAPPYITYKIYDDYDRVLFNDVENETFDVHIQFKAISNSESEAKTLGQELRKLFFLQQPAYELYQQHIIAQSCDAIPPVDQYLDVDWQFTAGADYAFEVQDNFTDQTQTGTISTIKPQFNIKKGDAS